MITIVMADREPDWVALYRDGRLLAQGHTFDPDDLLSLLGVEHEAVYALCDGRFPETWPA